MFFQVREYREFYADPCNRFQLVRQGFVVAAADSFMFPKCFFSIFLC